MLSERLSLIGLDRDGVSVRVLKSGMMLGRIGWSIGYERAAACSAVKATRFAGDPNKFGRP